MLQLKQTTGLDYLLRYAVNSIRTDTQTVTLTRNDSKVISFKTNGIEGVGGEDGEPGDQGLPGESAYDIAIRLGKTDKSLEKWLLSLKGDIGPKGIDGKDGKDRFIVNQNLNCDITAAPVVWLRPGEKLAGSIEDNILFLKLPTIKVKTVKHDLLTGEFSVGEKAEVTIVNDKLNVTVAAGKPGIAGKDNIGKDTAAPMIDLAVSYVKDDKKPVVICTGTPTGDKFWTKKVRIKIPRGKTGEVGPRGKQGKSKAVVAPSVMKTLIGLEIQDPGLGFSCIKMDNFAGYRGTANGWSWRTKDMTFQLVYFVDETNGFWTGWWYRTGPAVGLVAKEITRGWERCKF